MASPRAVGRWRSIHKWSSLICTVFILITCVTGLPLIFEDELEAWTTPRPAPARNGEPKLGLEDVLRVAQSTFPGERAWFVYWPDAYAGMVGVGLVAKPDATDDDVHRILVDLSDGHVDEEQSGSRVLRFLLDLHRNLFLDRTGELVLGAAAVALVLALVSGLFVYRPFARKLDFAAIRRTTRRIAWLDTHNLVGIATFTWVLVVAVSGFMNTLEGRLFDAWQSDRMPAIMARYGAGATVAHRSSVDAAVATARAAAGNAEATSVTFPGTPFGTPRHYLIWVHGDSPITSRLFTPILVDGETGELAAIEPLPWYLRAVELSRPLHFGDYGGLPLKALWAVLDLFAIYLLVSGIYLWLRGTRRVEPESNV